MPKLNRLIVSARPVPNAYIADYSNPGLTRGCIVVKEHCNTRKHVLKLKWSEQTFSV